MPAQKTQHQSANILSCRGGGLLTLGAGFRGRDMSGTATALWKEGLLPLPNARSECQCDGAGWWGIGSPLLSWMSEVFMLFEEGEGQTLENNLELPEASLVLDGSVWML